MNAPLVFWLDRAGIAHEGRQPHGPDDYHRYTTCGEHRVQDLHRAIGFPAPTCLRCMAKRT